jgi:pSer/pThr/pTyr-binding forkhead associated (FHA) protein
MVVESQTPPYVELPSPGPEQAAPLPERSSTTAGGRTTTDPKGSETRVWLDHEPVIHLRERGTERVHPLPGPDVSVCVIGSDPSAALRLFDTGGLVSRAHARLVREGTQWKIEDLQSKNGLRQDGTRNLKFPVVPGVEIGIGSLNLIAENRPLVQLRKYLARVLGWDPDGQSLVEVAIQALRAAANKRQPLVLGGADDLVAVARQIHRRTTSPVAPFVVCGRRLCKPDLSVNVTATHADPATAFELAAGGTVCVRAEKLPVRLEWLMEVAAELGARFQTQLIICAGKPIRWWKPSQSILVPTLARRSVIDLRNIVADYAIDAIMDLDAAPTSFTIANRDWVVRHAAKSFADIEVATLRIVACNDSGNVHRAAARLGLSHAALGKWLKHRRLAV